MSLFVCTTEQPLASICLNLHLQRANMLLMSCFISYLFSQLYISCNRRPGITSRLVRICVSRCGRHQVRMCACVLLGPVGSVGRPPLPANTHTPAAHTHLTQRLPGPAMVRRQVWYGSSVNSDKLCVLHISPPRAHPNTNSRAAGITQESVRAIGVRAGSIIVDLQLLSSTSDLDGRRSSPQEAYAARRITYGTD